MNTSLPDLKVNELHGNKALMQLVFNAAMAMHGIMLALMHEVTGVWGNQHATLEAITIGEYELDEKYMERFVALVSAVYALLEFVANIVPNSPDEPAAIALMQSDEFKQLTALRRMYLGLMQVAEHYMQTETARNEEKILELIRNNGRVVDYDDIPEELKNLAAQLSEHADVEFRIVE